MSDKIDYNYSQSFNYNGMRVHTLGNREKTRVKKVLIGVTLGLAALPIFLLIIDLTVFGEIEMFWIGLWVYLGMLPLVILPFIPVMINNNIMYPSIGLREDGVIMIFRSNTKVEYLEDQIMLVDGVRHVSTAASSYTVGNTRYTTYTTTTHTWGKVIFTLKRPTGEIYKKAARNVADCMSTASKILTMLKK